LSALGRSTAFQEKAHAVRIALVARMNSCPEGSKIVVELPVGAIQMERFATGTKTTRAAFRLVGKLLSKSRHAYQLNLFAGEQAA